jgi:chromosome partitioning protein
MIILIGNEKGGVGKSTIAINLAVQRSRSGKDVIIVDADKQGTSSNFIARRNEQSNTPKIHLVQKTGDLFDTLKDLETRYQEVIVDAGGQDSDELRSSMIAASLMIVPVKASQIDLWAASRMDNLIKQVKTINRQVKVVAMISMAPTNPQISEYKDAVEFLKDYPNLPLIKSIIRERKIYRDSIIEGKGVVELPNNKACEEIIKFENEVFNGK